MFGQYRVCFLALCNLGYRVTVGTTYVIVNSDIYGIAYSGTHTRNIAGA
jgi:hypothetical protein